LEQSWFCAIQNSLAEQDQRKKKGWKSVGFPPANRARFRQKWTENEVDWVCVLGW